MPNHVHGLLTLEVLNTEYREATQGLPYEAGRAHGLPSLSNVVGWFKTMSANWYMRGVRMQGWPPFDGHLWQRSFHDHIVRDDADMDRIRTYIDSNPALWNEDTFHGP